MIYTVEFVYSDGNVLKCASDSLQECIDYVNEYAFFPTIANQVIFSAWKDKQRITASFDGWRGETLDGNGKGKFTYSEVESGFKKLSKSV